MKFSVFRLLIDFLNSDQGSYRGIKRNVPSGAMNACGKTEDQIRFLLPADVSVQLRIKKKKKRNLTIILPKIMTQ